MSRTCATPLCKGRPEKLDAWGNDVCAPCWRADHGLRATRGDPSEVPPTPRDAAPPPPYRPPETPVPATAPTSAPSSTPPSAPSPVAAGVGGGASSRARRCRWPGHEDAEHNAHGFCQRDTKRLALLGIDPRTIADEDVANLTTRWAEHKARVSAKVRADRAQTRAATVAAGGGEGAPAVDPRDARIAELERELAEEKRSGATVRESLRGVEAELRDAGAPACDTYAGGIRWLRRRSAASDVAAIAELLDRVEAPRLAEDGETELPLDARVAWLTDGFRSEVARAEKAEADLREAREIKTGQDRAFVEATAFAQQEAAKREAVLVERAEKAEVALATLRACLDEAFTPGAEARDFGLAEEDRHRIRSFVERVDASRAAVVEEPRVPAVARPVDVSREIVIFASLVESVEADMLAGVDTAMRARLVPLFRALRALGGVA